MNTKDDSNNFTDILKPVTGLPKFTDCYIVGNVVGNIFQYKYMNMEVALNVIKSGLITFRFQQPTQWKDKYESLYYNADYSKITSDKSTHPQLYACCFTRTKLCEAAWRIYAGNSGISKNCVQFKISKSKFRKALANYADKNGLKVYEGVIDYRRQFIIENLHHSSVSYSNMKLKKLHDDLFCNVPFAIDNYLSLLLLKRDAFEYENEYRYFLVPTRGRMKKYIDIPFKIKDIIEKIFVEQSCDNNSYDKFEKHCTSENIGSILEKVDIYNDKIGKIGRITIEK